MKKCTVCKQDKPLNEFYNNSVSSDKKCYRCKVCDNKVRIKYRQRHYKSVIKKERSRMLKNRYGITSDEYVNLLKKQNYCCKICRRHVSKNNILPDKSGTKRFSIDHCHRTGNIRGLLCGNCNRAIGLMNDDPELLQQAMRYLNYETH